MNEDLTVNTKFFSFKGILGRHDFFLNIVYISFITILVILPLNLYVFFSMGSFSDLLEINKLFSKAPILLKIWTVAGYCIILPLYISTYFRRLNDINGKVNNFINILCVIPLISSYLLISLSQMIISYIVSFVVFIILLCKRGKITSQLPYDYRKEFNWGAFFGTWIWGLFNKSYLTLLHLILWCTPFGFYFKLVCGLKGNEWAYKNKKWKSPEKFNMSQERQATFWVIFSFVIAPALWFLLIVGGSILFAIQASTTEDGKQNMAKLEKYVDSVSASYFKTYYIGTDENKFYVLDSDWKTYSFNDKMELMRTAASIAVKDKTNKEKSKELSKRKYYSNYGEMKITKIYSANSGKLLGEYKDSGIKKDAGFIDYMKETFNAFRFYSAD